MRRSFFSFAKFKFKFIRAITVKPLERNSFTRLLPEKQEFPFISLCIPDSPSKTSEFQLFGMFLLLFILIY